MFWNKKKFIWFYALDLGIAPSILFGILFEKHKEYILHYNIVGWLGPIWFQLELARSEKYQPSRVACWVKFKNNKNRLGEVG